MILIDFEGINPIITRHAEREHCLTVLPQLSWAVNPTPANLQYAPC